MTTIFDTIKINELTLPNRVVKSAMVEGRAREGHATPELAAMYRQWSKGGVGLAITGLATVMEGYSLTNGTLGLWDDVFVKPLKSLADAAHEHAGKVFVQLSHIPPQMMRSHALRLGSIAPSAGLNRQTLTWNREATSADFLSIAAAFGRAAGRARAACIDGVQIHAAHGYLLSRTLSPVHNRRKDRWGGSFDRRLTFFEEVYRSIRKEVGPDYPVAVKLNAHDGTPGRGLRLEDSVRIARRLEEWGIDAIEVSAGTCDVGLSFYPNKGGIPWDLGSELLRREFPQLRPVLPLSRLWVALVGHHVRMQKEAYFLEEASSIAEAVRIPVIAVGGIRTLDTANRILRETPVQMISMARPLVKQPNLVNDWLAEMSYSSTCSNCNRCYVGIALEQPLTCREGALGHADRGLTTS